MVERTNNNPTKSTTAADSEFTLEQLKKIIEVPKGDYERAFNQAAQAGREELAKKFRVVCMIGLTGHGKSSTANSLSGQDKFTVLAGTESETIQITGLLSKWQGKKEEDPLIVIDTPGLGDSKNRDTEHLPNWCAV